MHSKAELAALFAKQAAERSKDQVIYDKLVYDVLKEKHKISGKDLIEIKDLLDEYRKAVQDRVP